jgi:hypothetical protein
MVEFWTSTVLFLSSPLFEYLEFAASQAINFLFVIQLWPQLSLPPEGFFLLDL